MRDIQLGETIYHRFTTRAFATGVPTTLSGTPVISVYEENNLTQITSGVTLTVDYDSVTGLNQVAIVATGANGYESGKSYDMVITTGTVGGVSVVGEVVGSFTVEASAAAQDLANATDGLGAIKTVVDAIEVDTQDLQTQIGTDGAGLTAIPWNAAWDAEVQSEVNDALVAYSVVATTDLPTNFGSMAITAGGAVTAGTVSDKTGYNLADGAITAAKFAADAIDSTALAASAVNEIADQVADEALSGHTTIGTVGRSLINASYMGPYGPGIYVDDGAANTNTVTGADGTPGQPVSTFTAARTIADAIGVKRYYLTGNATAIDIPATTEDWHFCGLSAMDSNIVDLNSADVDRSYFQNLTIQGVQGGTGRILAVDCILQDDPGVGNTDLHVHAIRCGLPSADPGIRLTNNDDHIFEQWYSMVPGNGTPMVDAQSGANVALNMRHGSGGIELAGLSATSTTSVETDGQVVFNASNTATAPVTMRGMLTITDNASMTNLTEKAVFESMLDDGTNVFNRATDSLQAIRDRGDANWTTGAGGTPPDLLISTTIATLTSQTVFTLTAGSGDDSAYDSQIVILTDQTTSNQKSVRGVSTYVGGTLTVTLDAAPDFTIAIGDTVEIVAATGAGGSGLTQQQVRDSLKLAPTAGAPAAGSVDQHLDDIEADTNELQTDWADGGRLDVTLDARASQATADAIEVDTQDIQNRLPVALVDGRIDSNVGAVNGDASVPANLEASLETMVLGTATGGTTGTVTSGVTGHGNDTFIGRALIFRTGALQYEAGLITDYDSTTGEFTFAANTWTAAPTTETFVIV